MKGIKEGHVESLFIGFGILFLTMVVWAFLIQIWNIEFQRQTEVMVVLFFFVVPTIVVKYRKVK